MLRKLFVFCSSITAAVAAAAAGVFLWKRRDELGAEVERIRGERRAGLRTAPSARHGAPRQSASPPGSAPRNAAPSPSARVSPQDTGAANPPTNGRVPGKPEARVTPLDTEAGPAEGDSPEETATQSRCQAKTNSGNRCARAAEPGSEFCWQHEPS